MEMVLGSASRKPDATRQGPSDWKSSGELSLELSQRVLALLRTVATRVNSAAPTGTVLQEVLHDVCAFTHWPVGHAFLLQDEPGSVLASPVAYVADQARFGDFAEALVRLPPEPIAGLRARVLSSGAPACTTQLASRIDGPHSRATEQVGLESAVAVPILAGPEVVGILEFHSTELSEPPSGLLELLSDIGMLAGRTVERHRSEASRIRLKTELAAVIEASQEAYISTDAGLEVREWNQEAERTFGWSRAEALGRVLTELILTPEQREVHRHDIERFLQVGESRLVNKRVELTALRKDGSEIPVELTLAPMKLQNEYVFNAFMHDISDRKRAERELREREWEQRARTHAEAERARLAEKATELAALTRELEIRNRELDQFAYVASHDLKAPLRGIANLAFWLAEDLGDVADGESQEHLRLLRERVRRMETLIDGLLSYSRAGRSTEPERVDVRELVEEIVELLAPPDHFKIDIASDLPVITAMETPLRQVLHNLIANAIKYNDSSAPSIAIGVQEGAEHYEFSVADNGPGISEAYHSKIWGLFQKLESSDHVEGAGMGLALVKKIVETTGGRVAVDSALGRGAVFRFSWPKQQKANDAQ
jgi:PAS domain S-box-containing protein